MDDLDEIVAEFLVESHENLDQLDRDLVALEQDPTSRQLLGSVFRTIHTIKGTTGFFEFGHLEALTHAGESLLSRLRDGELSLAVEITDSLLMMVDAVRALLAAIEATGQEGEPDHAALIATLTRLQHGGADAPAGPSEAPPPATGAAPEQRQGPPTNPSSPPVGEVIVEHGGATPDDVTLAMTAQNLRIGILHRALRRSYFYPFWAVNQGIRRAVQVAAARSSMCACRSWMPQL